MEHEAGIERVTGHRLGSGRGYGSGCEFGLGYQQEQSEEDAAKCYRKVLDRMIQAAEEVVEHAKGNNLLRQEVIDTENELAKAAQARNSQY